MGDAFLQLDCLLLALVEAVLCPLVGLEAFGKSLNTLSIGNLQFFYFFISSSCCLLQLLLFRLELFILGSHVCVVLLHKWLFLAVLLKQTPCLDNVRLVLVPEIDHIDKDLVHCLVLS